MVQTMAPRVVPVAEWAPIQEAMYAEPASLPKTAHAFRSQQPESASSVTANEPRYRSMSISLPWRQRPKSSLFAPDDVGAKFADLSLEKSKSHSYAYQRAERHRRASGGALENMYCPPPKGKTALRGMIRRASVSIKGMLPHRASISASTEEGHQPPRVLGSSHGYTDGYSDAHSRSHSHSHSYSAATNFEAPPPGRPATAHSTWRRLRQAASFRQNRAPYGEYPGLETIESPREATFSVPPVPVPGNGYGPPIIPPNTGGAARAAAAAFQSEFQRKWLYPDEYYQNDRESGIGIAVTSTDDELSDGPDVDTDLDGGEAEDEVLGISRVDFVSELPTELAINVLAQLDAAGLATASQVSRSWNAVVQNQHIWREAFLREKTSTFATSESVRPGAGHGVPPVRPTNDWRQIYRVKQTLDRRWKEGKARPVYLNGHSDSIYCLQFDENKIITGSRDRTIRVWDMHTLACRLVIGPPEVIHDPNLLYDDEGQPTHYATTESNAHCSSSMPAAVSFPTHHKASILCLQYDDRILVTGSSDSSCIVYNVRSGYRPIRRLAHHSAAVLDLCFDERYIVTCSKDISIGVWDRATGALIKQMRGHSGPVNAVQMRGNLIVSCSGDFRVKLWNIETGRAIREFEGHTKGLACSQFSDDGRYVASAGNDRVIRIWDANTGECVHEMKAHENLVRSLHIDSVSGRLVSGSYDTDIKVFDMATGRPLLDFPRWHASWVLSAKSDYRRIISTGQDPKILIMDFGAGVDGIEMLESSCRPGGEAEVAHEVDEVYI